MFVERPVRQSTPRSHLRRHLSTMVTVAVMAVSVSAASLVAVDSPAGASKISSARAQAAALYNKLQAMNMKISALGQQYDQAQNAYQGLLSDITHLRQTVDAQRVQVSNNKKLLAQAAVNAYINSGADVGSSPLFNSNANTSGAQSVYGNVAAGNIQDSVSRLQLSNLQLTQEKEILANRVSAARSQAAIAAAALNQAQSLQAQVVRALASVRGAIAQYLAQQQAAQAANDAKAWAAAHHGAGGLVAPAPNRFAAAAIRFAMSMIGVPYVWGGTSRRGVDCSGLTMLAWGAAGVGLPHYSGSQMANTIRIPLYDLRPGDLLFYGPGGSEHVAMYLGRGLMIEAPTWGQRVHVTGVRLGWGFAGAGRPRV
jgi:cell wall-associated NlpC family hydrolase